MICVISEELELISVREEIKVINVTLARLRSISMYNSIEMGSSKENIRMINYLINKKSQLEAIGAINEINIICIWK